MLWRCRLSRPFLASAIVVTSACRAGGSEHPQAGEPGEAAGAAHGAARGAVAAASPVRVAERPPNGCGWISAAEVAAVIGPLAGPPRPVASMDNPVPRPTGTVCRYDLVVSDSVLAERRKEEQRRQLLMARFRELQRQLGGPDTVEDSIRADEEEADAVLVEVDPEVDVIGERALGAAAEILGGWAGADSAAGGAAEQPKPPDGWDFSGAPLPGYSGFGARIGHVGVAVTSLRSRFPREKTRALAARVREALPDLPFATERPSRSPSRASADPDPCGLLTRADAEAVLGPLVVAPYRAAAETPLADANGTSCAYYTAGHHALVLTPEWSGGKFSIKAERIAGGLIGIVARDREAESADTLEGPWDDVAASGHSATLLFLKGDRLLNIGYGFSSIGPADVIRLARTALGRL